LEVLLVPPGGPSWAKKDAGAWSIPKGEYSEGEDPLAAAKREFSEETAIAVDGEFIPLGEVKQAGSKIVIAWALEGDLDPKLIQSNTFTMEWPPRSGLLPEFPEVDAASWFSLGVAQVKLLTGQVQFLTRLSEHVGQKGIKLSSSSSIRKRGLRSIGSLARWEEISSAVLWLCSEGASFVIVSALAADGRCAAKYEEVFHERNCSLRAARRALRGAPHAED